jgi:predicted anti-sigma-YlaC factor YlaD
MATLHLTEDDLVLHYYGEMSAPEETLATEHLGRCAECRTQLTQLQRVLGVLDESAVGPVELPEGFERIVWARLQPNLRRHSRGWFSWMLVSPAPLALAAAVVVLVGAAFFAGRFFSTGKPAQTSVAKSDQVRERILLVDLGDHLDRSQMVLVELVSNPAEGSVDMSGERARAEELVAANRLYRQTAAVTGDTAIGDLLDELERVLVDVAASPEWMSSQEMDAVRRRIESRGLLFKVRVVSSEVRERQKEGSRSRGL